MERIGKDQNASRYLDKGGKNVRDFRSVSIKIEWLTLEPSPLVNLGMVLYYERVAMGYTMYSSIHWAKLTESQIFTLSA